MDDILPLLNIGFFDESSRNGRSLAASGGDWKAQLWSQDSVTPAIQRGPFVVLVFVLLWYMNLVLLDKNKVNYAGVMGIKTPTLDFTLSCGFIIGLVYFVTMGIGVQMGGFTAEMAITLFYGAIVIFVMCINLPSVASLFPSDAHIVENKGKFFRLCRNVVWPGQSVAFAEIVFADALTSLSKVFKDAAITIVAVYSSITQTPITDLHEQGMILVAVLASVPFLIRVRQCWVQFEGQHDAVLRIPIFLNIVKYMSAFPPIWLAAAATLGFYHQNLPTYIMLTTSVNSLYSFLWDIVMDWGLMSFSREGKCSTRQRFLYPTITYLLVSSTNLFLRFAWAANKFEAFAGLDASTLVLALELVEVFRRSVWNMYRIEWEIITVESKDKLLDSKVANSGGKDGDLESKGSSSSLSAASLRV
jgi:hypothetical protein